VYVQTLFASRKKIKKWRFESLRGPERERGTKEVCHQLGVMPFEKVPAKET